MKYTVYVFLAILLTPTAAVLAAMVLSLTWPHDEVPESQSWALSAYAMPSDFVDQP
ncbi:MAG: hypothetical protein K0R40_3047 [Burkholderiales bacterium]|jgi:hypothetical protein|nr:hypothetical protein [Burkholderiales bacterium]